MSDQKLSILIRAILEKNSKAQIEAEIEEIQQKFNKKPLEIKIDKKALEVLQALVEVNKKISLGIEQATNKLNEQTKHIQNEKLEVNKLSNAYDELGKKIKTVQHQDANRDTYKQSETYKNLTGTETTIHTTGTGKETGYTVVAKNKTIQQEQLEFEKHISDIQNKNFNEAKEHLTQLSRLRKEYHGLDNKNTEQAKELTKQISFHQGQYNNIIRRKIDIGEKTKIEGIETEKLNQLEKLREQTLRNINNIKAKSTDKSIIQQQKQVDDFNKRNLTAIDYEIEKRELQGQQFSKALQSKMRQETEDSKHIEIYKKMSLELQKLQQNAQATNTILKNFGGAEHHKKADALTSSLQKLNIVENTTQQEMQETINKAKLLSNQLQNVSKEAKATGNNSMTMGNMIGTAFEKFSIWMGVTSLYFGVIQAIRQAAKEVIELNTAVTELNKVLETSKGQLADYTEQSFVLGDKLNRTGKDVLLATAEFARAGYNLQESNKLAEQALLLTNIADGLQDTAEASGYLIAVLKGYNLTASDTVHIVDLLNEVSNNYAVNTVKLAEGLQRASGTLSQTGTSVEELTGILTGGYEVLRNMEKVSTGLITISSRLRGISETGEEIDGLMPKLQKAFKEYAGIDIQTVNGEMRSTYDILQDLSKVWSTLNDEQRGKIGELASGIRQAPVLNAILLNWKNVEGAAKTALDSTGSAIAENEKFMASLEGKINDLNSALSKLAYDTINSDLFGSLIDLGTLFVKLADKIGIVTIALGSLWGVLSLSSKFTFLIPIIDGLAMATGRWAISMGFASTTAGVLAAAISTLTPVAIVVAIYGAIKAIDHFTTSLSEQREIVQTLTSDLQNLQSEYDKLASNNNRTKQEEKHLAILQAQLKAKQDLLTIETKELTNREYLLNSDDPSDITNFAKTKNTYEIKNNISDLQKYNDELLKLNATADGAYEKEQKLNKSIAESTDFLSDKYKNIQNSIKILEEANEQESEEYETLISLSNAIEEVINKTSGKTKETEKSTEATLDAKKAADDFNDSATKMDFKTASDNLKFYQETLDKLNTDGLTSDLMVLARTHEDLKDKTINNVEDYKKVLLEGIEESKNNWINAEYEKQFINNESLENMAGQFQKYQAYLKENYGIDVKNWGEVAKSKAQIEAELLKALASNWANYYGKVKGNYLAIAMNAPKMLMDQQALMEQLRFVRELEDASKNFDTFTPDFSSVGSSKGSSSKEAYISDQYAISTAKLDQELKSLEYTKSKLSQTSEEYRNALQKEIDISKQKQQLAHEEADRLRALQSQVAAGSKEYDEYTKSIQSLQSAWVDLQSDIDAKNIEIVTSKLEEFDKVISDINDKLQRNKSEMQNLLPGTAEYSNKLQEQIELTKEYIKTLEEKQRYLEIEIVLETTNIARKNELIDVLKNVKQALFDLRIDLTSQLASQADEVISIFKSMYEQQKQLALDALDAQMDAEDKRHEAVTDNLDDEIDQYEELIQAKLKLLEKEAAQESYTKKLSKTQTEAQEIQNQINILSLDDSFEAKAKKEELEKELAEKLESIEEMQFDHTLDARRDNLNDLLDAHKKQISDKKKTEDKIYDIEKERLEKIKRETQRYWDNQINDERKWAQLKVDIMNGNLNEVKNSFANFTNILNGNLETISTSIVNNLIDRMAQAKESIDSINSQIDSLPSSDPSYNDNYREITKPPSNTETGLVKPGMLLTEAGAIAGVEIKYNPSDNTVSIGNLSTRFSPTGIGGTHLNAQNRIVIDSIDNIKRLIKMAGGDVSRFHSGGIVGDNSSPSSITKLTDKLFNTNANEQIIKALKNELYVPEINLNKFFKPNMSNLISSLTPQISLAGGGNSGGDTIYNLNLHIDNVTGDKNGGQTVYKEVIKGLHKMGK